MGITGTLVLGGVIAEIGSADVADWTADHPFITSLCASLLVLALGYAVVDRLLDRRQKQHEQALWIGGLQPLMASL